MISFSSFFFPSRSRFGLTNCSSLCLYFHPKYPTSHLRTHKYTNTHTRRRTPIFPGFVCAVKKFAHFDSVCPQLPHNAKVVCWLFFFIPHGGKLYYCTLTSSSSSLITASEFSSYLRILLQLNSRKLLIPASYAVVVSLLMMFLPAVGFPSVRISAASAPDRHYFPSHRAPLARHDRTEHYRRHPDTLFSRIQPAQHTIARYPS